MKRSVLRQWALGVVVALMGVAVSTTGLLGAEDRCSTPLAKPGGPIVLKVVMVENEDAVAAGKAAAEQLKESMGPVALKAVILSECFEDRPYKEKLIEGISSVLPKEIIHGGATYGSFTQDGCTEYDSVCLLGIGGEGISVAGALVTDMGTAKLVFEDDRELIAQRLTTAGKNLAAKLRKTDRDRLLILIPDAHSPKNQLLVEGVQQIVGKRFPITGGCANKNAGQTFVYFRGKAYQDAAVALMLSGNFEVTMAGREARDNDGVIRTAKEAAASALSQSKGKPAAVLAFNCAGRRSKLKDMDDELAAIQQAIGRQLPLFGCYCAGEIGPLDTSEKQPGVLSGGGGWHVMFTIIAR